VLAGACPCFRRSSAVIARLPTELALATSPSGLRQDYLQGLLDTGARPKRRTRSFRSWQFIAFQHEQPWSRLPLQWPGCEAAEGRPQQAEQGLRPGSPNAPQ
jgi:hypothetical protein